MEERTTGNTAERFFEEFDEVASQPAPSSTPQTESQKKAREFFDFIDTPVKIVSNNVDAFSELFKKTIREQLEDLRLNQGRVVIANYDGGNDSGNVIMVVSLEYPPEYDRYAFENHINTILGYEGWTFDGHANGIVYWDGSNILAEGSETETIYNVRSFVGDLPNELS